MTLDYFSRLEMGCIVIKELRTNFVFSYYRLPTVWKKKHQNNDDNAENLFHFVLAFILIIFSLNLLLVPSLICYRSCTRVFPTPFYYNQVIQISFSRRTDLYPLIYGYSQNQNWACRWTVKPTHNLMIYVIRGFASRASH